MKNKSIEHFIIADRGLIPKARYQVNPELLPTTTEIKLCESWLQEFTKKSSDLFEDRSSYSLKEYVEKWSGSYVSNGAFIYAAQSLGINVIVSEDGPNAHFFIDLYTDDEAWTHVRPLGFSKWLFDLNDDGSPLAMLSLDAKSDKNWPTRSKNFYDFWGYLLSIRCSQWALDTLQYCWDLYAGESSVAPNDRIIQNVEGFFADEVEGLMLGDQHQDAPDGFTYIYCLFEEHEYFNKLIRYIGQTVSPANRIKQHTVAPGNIEKVAWVGGLLNKDTYPKMAILDLISITNSIKEEEKYIHYANFYQKWEFKLDPMLLNKQLIKFT